ncbi:SDR family oxidoreductase [Fischerella muscicola]|uniref:SDR family oxidoreductase n=1 Tax=Fischerella muscicola CCMEE 5323 TaxID=2019572 RepID=A0A2N6JX35_FISMU|nr:SDR family oxidoreductase [Fischerella muscicola]PLZ84816.1 SDR family oxidoreductase [Fischerella muscicola CCMEE 5323]
MNNFQGKVALITGASRGIGASVAQMLAAQGADIVINYRSKSSRAEEVANAVRGYGRNALVVQADMTNESQMQEMIKRIEEQFGRLDFLILNASGGLEKDKTADYAMRLNLTAQLLAMNLSLPLIGVGGRIIFITSHLAHFYGQQPVYTAYEPVAQSKKAGEEALRAQIPQLATKGIKLVVVSGDLIEGTITPKLMQRNSPGLIDSRRQQAGSLPTVEEFARAIVNATADPQLESGATIFVGSTDW